MIIVRNAVIVFQLIECLVEIKKTLTKAMVKSDMVEFAYQALPTRHDESLKPHLWEDEVRM